MELVYLAFILFILGIGSTIIYDKYKSKYKDIYLKYKEIKSRPKPVGVPQPKAKNDLESLLQNVRERARRGQVSVKIQQGNKIEATSLKQLLEQLEEMKKNV